MDKAPSRTDRLHNNAGEHQEWPDKSTEGRIVANVEQVVIDSVKTDDILVKQHRDGYDKANIIILGFTFLAALAAAVFTGWMAIRTNQIANDSENTYDATNRAYIAITGVKWDGRPEVGKNQRIKILFKNVGKQAASDFSLIAFVSDPFFFEPDGKQMPYIDPALVKWPYVGSCVTPNPAATQVVGQRPVYPDVMNEGITYAFNKGPDFLPQRIVDGTASFWIAGCATYTSLGRPRYSPFCFYYQPARGKDVTDGTFEWCPIGSGNAR